jgi:hypothetical protein
VVQDVSGGGRRQLQDWQQAFRAHTAPHLEGPRLWEGGRVGVREEQQQEEEANTCVASVSFPGE